ncbi:MAG: methylase [Herbaspirillum sp.]|jgi:hypothetical protein|nr:methylase [Herbaspirillum sp.]
MSVARPLIRAPAVQALLLQGAALLLALLLEWGWTASTSLAIPPLADALLQGAIAAALSRRAGLARWWLPIQLLFPAATLLVGGLHLPPSVFLGGFLFFLLLFWSTFRTQVPYYPSLATTWRAVEGLLPSSGPVRLIDIGSGLGGLVLSLAGRHPQGAFSGIEIAPLPWLISRLRALCTGSRAQFALGDYMRLDFAQYDVVFAYLSPVAMTALWSKASAEMRPGSLLLSYEFEIDGIVPDIAINTSNKGAILYGWRI